MMMKISLAFFLLLAITVDAGEIVAYVGETLSLRCTVTNSYQQFFWIKDSTVLAKSTPDGVTFDPNRMGIRYPSAEDRELTIYDVTKNDEGTYTCHVTFKDGTTTVSSDQVRVESRIANDFTTSTTEVTTADREREEEEQSAISNVAEQTIRVGDELTLVCPFYMVSAKYNWQKDGVPIAYGPPDTVNVDAGRISVNASSNGWLLLHIDPVRLEDAGTYLCVVDISFGPPFQMSKKVRVLAEEEQVTTTRDMGTTYLETTSLVYLSTSQKETLLYPSTDVNSSSPRSSASRVFRSYGLFIGIIFIHFHQALFM